MHLVAPEMQKKEQVVCVCDVKLSLTKGRSSLL